MGEVAGILLAAGRGTRLGLPKALLRWGAETFVARAVRTWGAICEPVVVVGGARFAEVKAQVAPPGVAVFNSRFEGGMITSLQVGIASLPPSVRAVVVGPVDQPLLDARLLGELVAAWRETPDHAIVPEYQGRVGHPVVLPAELATALAAEPEWSSLERFLEANAARVRRLPTERAEALRNINTPEEYREFMTLALRAGDTLP